MDPRSLLEPLLSLPKFGAGPGLTRLARLCEPLLNSAWFRGTSVIHVVGTDGKGSVAAMLHALFGGLGIRCGCYTSPHLFRFHERIAVDGEPIDDTALAAAIHWFQGQAESYRKAYPEDTIGAFEAFTAVALYHFSQRQPRVLVVEAGIGGRQDCTRALGGDLALLTSVDLEHTALLGDTLEAIAADKMDILDPGGTLVIGDLPGDLTAFIRRRSAGRGLKVCRAAELIQWYEIHQGRNGMVLQGRLNQTPIHNLHCALTGPHQAANLALALAAIHRWLTHHCLYLHPERLPQAAHQVLPELRWPGRFQRIHGIPPVYVDVGHTPQAMRMLAATVQQTALPAPILVLGVSQGRQPAELLAPILAEAHAVILSQAHHRGMAASQLAAALPGVAASVEADLARAMDRALALARPQNRPVLVAGGLFVAVEAAAWLRGQDPRGLLLF